jgi:hypothetical protein
VYFNIRHILPKYGTFLLGHPVLYIYMETKKGNQINENIVNTNAIHKYQIPQILSTLSKQYFA